jgi:REP element-mobilizing transposase RayT/ribosomal protein L37AE/L43A
VSLGNVRVMSGLRFRCAPGGGHSLGLHLVWCPKYRRRVLGGRVARRLDELIGQIADGHGWQIVAFEMMPDHVHVFVRLGPIDNEPLPVTGKVHTGQAVGIDRGVVHTAADDRGRFYDAPDTAGLDKQRKFHQRRLAKHIEYKAELASVTWVAVPAAYTSQRCHQCGHTARENRESQAVFRCKACAWSGNADTNAAVKVRGEALARWAAQTEQLAGTSAANAGGEAVSQAGSRNKTDPLTGPAPGLPASATNRQPPTAA